MLWWPLWSILVNFGAFWCTSCATPQSFHDLYWLLSPFMCPSNPEIDHISHSGQIQNTALSCYGDHFGPIWSILVHFSATHVQPHNPSMTCTDFYPLSSVHLIQKKIILVTQDKSETLWLSHTIMTILVHFGLFRRTSWATPWPLSIKFS